jgi:transposase InsO family protein
MCGKLLVAVIPDLLAALERHGELRVTPQAGAALLAISPATIDRVLRPARRALGRQPRRQSPATTSLKAQIPIRTWSEWTDAQPGSVQADLVLHCGESVEGFFLTTLTVVDVATGWTEMQSVWGLGKQRVGAALHHVRKRLPFPLRELHTDNGSEFINYTLHSWCIEKKIACSRGRGYKKNDQAYVEQRNWLGVRRQIGYDRYNSKAAQEAMQRLYALLRLQMNFFRPLSKVISQERRGARVTKRYDAPKTPYQRLQEAGVLDEVTQAAMNEQLLNINPAQLQRNIELALRRLWNLTTRNETLTRKVG